MKTISSITLLFIMMGTASPKYCVERPASQIQFIDGSLQDALSMAKKDNKPIFVYVYAKWCGQCKKLKKSFKDDAAAEYFNAHFINVAINGESEEGNMVLDRYAVKSYPTLLILDSKGRLQTRTTGYSTPYLLMNFGKRIVPR